MAQGRQVWVVAGDIGRVAGDEVKAWRSMGCAAWRGGQGGKSSKPVALGKGDG